MASDESRFWGAFGFYAILTLVYCQIRTLDFLLQMKCSFADNEKVSLLLALNYRSWIFWSNICIAGLLLDWVGRWFLNFYSFSFHAFCMDLLQCNSKVKFASITQVMCLLSNLYIMRITKYLEWDGSCELWCLSFAIYKITLMGLGDVRCWLLSLMPLQL